MALCKESANAVMEKDARESDAPRRVCFVCTGNTCRSPMAAAVANSMRESDVDAVSAGLYAVEGAPITPEAMEALERAGVTPIHGRDYRVHLAHTVSQRDVDEAALLVAMTPSHAMELLMRFPAAAQKIACMPNAISDPFGGDLARYEQCLAEIKAGVRALLA